MVTVFIGIDFNWSDTTLWVLMDKKSKLPPPTVEIWLT